MNDLLLFLTSKEIIIVYLISAVACIICLIVYFVEKKNENVRKKHNTKELNKLVELVKDKVPVEEETVTYEVPVLEPINISPSISEMITTISESEEKIEENIEKNIEEQVSYNNYQDFELEVGQETEEIEYTTMEPDETTAKTELKRLEEELIKEEENFSNNIELTKFEEEQEKTAIISMEELLQRSRELYELNELTQYKDDGNEPISLQDLEKQINKQAASYEEPFIISNVVEENIVETKEEIKENIDINEFKQVQPQVIEQTTLNFQEVKQEVKVQKEPERKFKSTPFISPIFGIERENTVDNELALENTANYDKLDEEIKKTNKFVMTLKELQEELN